jgi:hypothetical protein
MIFKLFRLMAYSNNRTTFTNDAHIIDFWDIIYMRKKSIDWNKMHISVILYEVYISLRCQEADNHAHFSDPLSQSLTRSVCFITSYDEVDHFLDKKNTTLLPIGKRDNGYKFYVQKCKMHEYH